MQVLEVFAAAVVDGEELLARAAGSCQAGAVGAPGDLGDGGAVAYGQAGGDLPVHGPEPRGPCGGVPVVRTPRAEQALAVGSERQARDRPGVALERLQLR